jgi:hypothetical protein
VVTSDAVFEAAERLALEATRDPQLIPQYLAATKHAQALEGAPGWKGKRRMTQVEKMLAHLRANGSITQREAYIDLGVQSFHRRITDLKEIGAVLRPEPRVNKTTGQEYTRYHYLGMTDELAQAFVEAA